MSTTDTDALTVDGLTFEQWPAGQALDETDVSARAYITRIPEEKLAQFDPSWTDEEIMEWDGNFKMDGTLMLVCVERDIEAGDLRDLIILYKDFLAKAKG